ncbi:MAG: hypothetical protein QM622_07965 [Microbacterium sp.]
MSTRLGAQSAAEPGHTRSMTIATSRSRFHMHFTPTYSSWINQVGHQSPQRGTRPTAP